MRRYHNRLQLLVALPLVAVLAIPGIAEQPAPVAQQVRPQSAFGLFLDPHAAAEFSIVLPEGKWDF